MSLIVNGTEVTLPTDPRVSLLDHLRDGLHLTGTKKGCNQGACGACTVLVDGERILSCLALAVQYDGRRITTIEGLANGDGPHPLQAAFVEHDGFQCGYCTPSQICSRVSCPLLSGPSTMTVWIKDEPHPFSGPVFMKNRLSFRQGRHACPDEKARSIGVWLPRELCGRCSL